MKKIIVIGSGMGGLATGIYGQLNGFETMIFEAHRLPGGQCTSWNRSGYVFDACLHNLNGFKPQTKINQFWQGLGAMPCETLSRNEFVSAVFPDGTYFHDYLDVDKLEAHLKEISPEDTEVITEYIDAIRAFTRENDWFGKSNFGSIWEKLSIIPFVIPKIKYFKYTLRNFATRFKNPYLQRAFPLIRNSLPDVPLFAYLAEHTSALSGDISWPRGGGLSISQNMMTRYLELGGTIHYRQKVVKIITENHRACGVELEDGSSHQADFIVSNADGRKTIQQMLGNQYTNQKITRYCTAYSEDMEVPSAVLVFLGVNRDLSAYPSSLIMFLDKPETIGGTICDHLHLQIYGFDSSMAPVGKGVIKVELFGKPAYFSALSHDKPAYKAAKGQIAEQVISLLEKQFQHLRTDIEIVDVVTLKTWERYMGGTLGYHNFPRKYAELTDIRNVLDFMFGLNKVFTLPGLQNFYFCGQWVTSMGSLFSNALTGQTVVQKICKQAGVKFKAPSPPPQVQESRK